MSTLLDIAIKYRNAGLSIMPVKAKAKKVAISPRVDPENRWKQYQTSFIDDNTLDLSFHDGANGLAVVCGLISGGLELLDFDLKNDPENTVWDPLFEDIIDYFNGILPLPLIQTPSGGYHMYFRSQTPGRNQPLVKLKKNGGAVVETRGEGGYFLIPPSANYTHIAGPTIENTPVLSSEEREDLLSICRKYHKVFEIARQKPSAVRSSSYAITPWDAYNEDLTEPWEALLLEAGWEQSHDDGDRIHYKRPGSDNKYGANWHKDQRLFYVFTSSTVLKTPAHTPRQQYTHT